MEKLRAEFEEDYGIAAVFQHTEHNIKTKGESQASIEYVKWLELRVCQMEVYSSVLAKQLNK